MTSDAPRTAPPDGKLDLDEISESPLEEAEVRGELKRVEGFLRRLSLDDLRDGEWFAKLLTFSMDTYVRDVNAEYFTSKYPGLPADAVVQARIDLAARYATVEGGLSAAAYTGAVAATIGSGGGASPLTLPAAGASFAVDLVYMSQLQLRLAYDISVLYRVPLDLNDPEDLWKLIRVAFAVKSGEIGRGAIGKGVPVFLRPIVRKLYAGSVLAAGRSLPVVGKYLLRRNVIKFTIPAIGVPLSMAVNYWSTKTVGGQAAGIFRQEAWIAEAARRMVRGTTHHAELLWVLWLIIKSDGLVHADERLLLKHVTGLVDELDVELDALADLESVIDLDETRVWSMLESAEGDLGALYDAGVVAAVVDGKVNVNELTNLMRLAECCSVPYDEDAIRAAAKRRR